MMRTPKTNESSALPAVVARCPVRDEQLPPEVLDAFISDYLTVVYHVFTDPEYDRGWPPAVHRSALLDSIERRTLPALDTLTAMVAWVCWTTNYNRSQRPLTHAEIHAESAAWRLSDIIHGLRVHYIPRPVGHP
jgi:hypothetical protein